MGHTYDYGAGPRDPGAFVMPFGKFKGQRLRDIKDLVTLDWYLGQEWLRDPTKGIIQEWLAKPMNRRELEQQLEQRSSR